MASDMQSLMDAIAQMEGFNVSGSIAQRNNNPGNLRYAPTEVGSESTASGTFATFATPEDGWAALQSYIENAMASGATLRSFIYTYAPPTENDTSNYLNYLVSQVGIGADSLLSSLGVQSASTDDSGTGIDAGTITTVALAALGMGLVAMLVS
jgi:hypothetical protein